MRRNTQIKKRRDKENPPKKSGASVLPAVPLKCELKSELRFLLHDILVKSDSLK